MRSAVLTSATAHLGGGPAAVGAHTWVDHDDGTGPVRVAADRAEPGQFAELVRDRRDRRQADGLADVADRRGVAVLGGVGPDGGDDGALPGGQCGHAASPCWSSHSRTAASAMTAARSLPRKIPLAVSWPA